VSANLASTIIDLLLPGFVLLCNSSKWVVFDFNIERSALIIVFVV
jgi:hypothetical protein